MRKSSHDRGIIGRVLLALTVLCAFAFIATFSAFTILDIYDKTTKQNAIDGCVSILLAVFFAALGIYSNRLAAKLFASEKFVQSFRLHSKTFFKVIGLSTKHIFLLFRLQ